MTTSASCAGRKCGRSSSTIACTWCALVAFFLSMCRPYVAMFLFVCRGSDVQSRVWQNGDAMRCCRSVQCRHYIGIHQESMLSGLHGSEELPYFP